MFSNKNVIVIWVNGSQLTILGGKLTVPQTIAFPPNIISDLEVADQDALYALIKDWASKNPALAGMQIVWIFGQDVYFEHVMQENEKQTWDTIVVRFLDLLPFEEVESRVYTNTTETKVVAINKSFYTALKRGFALQGFITKMEIAASELGKIGEGNKLDSQVFGYIVKNMDTLEKNRLVSEEVQNDGIAPESAPSDTKQKKNSSLPLLIGVFVVLLGVLGFMIVRMYK